MPHFILTCRDKPAHLELRLATRPAHLDYLSTVKGVLFAGPLLDKPDGTPIGSIIGLEMADQSAIEAFLEHDPYTKAGLFSSHEIQPFKLAVSNL